MTSRPWHFHTIEAIRWADTRILPLTHAFAAAAGRRLRPLRLATHPVSPHEGGTPPRVVGSSLRLPELSRRSMVECRPTRVACTLDEPPTARASPSRSAASAPRFRCPCAVSSLRPKRTSTTIGSADFRTRFALARRPVSTFTRLMAPALSAAARPTHTTAQEQRMTTHLGLTHRRFNSIDRSGDNHHTTTSLSTDALSLNPSPTAATSASAACSQRSY